MNNMYYLFSACLRGSVAGPGTVNVEVPVVVADPGAQPRDLSRAHALPPVHLAQHPQVRASAQKALHSRHRQLIAPQDHYTREMPQSTSGTKHSNKKHLLLLWPDVPCQHRGDNLVIEPGC